MVPVNCILELLKNVFETRVTFVNLVWEVRDIVFHLNSVENLDFSIENLCFIQEKNISSDIS